MPVLQAKTNMLTIYSAVVTMHRRLRTDPGFKKAVREDPVGTLVANGIPRAVAVNILANDLGVPVESDWCVCTGCCCTACSVTGRGVVDVRALPALSDGEGWLALARGR